MKMRALFVSCVLVLGYASVEVRTDGQQWQPPRGPAVIISGPDGKRLVGFVPPPTRVEDVLSQPRARTTVQLGLLGRYDAHLADGQIITDIGFDGWLQGREVHLIVTTMVPADGSNRYIRRRLGEPETPMRKRAFTEFTLAVGQSRAVHEMKALGVEPLIVRVDAEWPER